MLATVHIVYLLDRPRGTLTDFESAILPLRAGMQACMRARVHACMHASVRADLTVRVPTCCASACVRPLSAAPLGP